uniref:Acyl carrier protein n=1 Tax=Wrangelia sp. TaxID=2575620 RepID=A0A4D6WZA2_9FLOR|nr:Acyl carrier protein [Wrangelia sp.]
MSTKVQESEIFDRLCIVVSNQLSIGIDKVTSESTFSDLGADSLDTVELVMAIEEEFGIEIPDDDAAQMSNVSDAVKYISSKGI